MILSTQAVYRETQQAVFHTLLADGSCDDMAVHEVIDGDITSMIHEAMGGLLPSASGTYGLSVMVYPPEVVNLEGIGGGHAQPQCTIKLEIINFEVVNFGSTGPSLWPATAAARIFDLLDGREFKWLGVMLIASPDAIRWSVSHQGDLRHYVTLAFRAPRVRAARVARPVPSATISAEPELTLTCATAGARIYYTTAAEGSTPEWPARSAATLYTGPLTFDTVTEVAAAAYLEGTPSSEVIMFQVTPQLLPHLQDEDGDEVTTEDEAPITTEG